MKKVTSDDLWFDFETAPPYCGNISIKYGELSKVLAWCQARCEGKFRWLQAEMPNDDNNKNGTYEFYFTEKADLLVFMLHWA
jgi:hypothetical protein